MAGYPVETCRACRSTERASMMYSLLDEDTRKLFSDCTHLQLPDPDDADSLGQLCAPCYEYCEGWYQFKTMCWKEDGDQSEIESFASDNESAPRNGYHPRNNAVEADNYSYNGFDEENSVASSPMIEDTTRDDLEFSSRGPREANVTANGDRLESMDTPWDCPCCSTRGLTYLAFREHLRNFHLNSNTQHCPVCNKYFSYIREIYHHIYGEHMGKLDCPHCHVTMNSFKTLKSHIQFAHSASGFKEPIDWICPICDKDMGDYYGCRLHLTNDHMDETGRICPICNETFDRKERTIGHILHTYMDVTQCRLCDRNCKKYTVLRMHFNECPKRFSEPRPPKTKEELKAMRLPIEPAPLPPPPPPPRKSIPKPRRLSIAEPRAPFPPRDRLIPQRRATISEGRPVQQTREEHKIVCPFCDKHFQSYQQLEIHLRAFHYQQTDGYNTCTLCEVVHDTKKDFCEHVLKDHMITRRNNASRLDSNWDCPICGEKYTDYVNLRLHLREIHLSRGDLSHTCPLCDASYTTPGRFYAHILKLHMKKWDCSGCSKSFNSSRECVIHMRKCKNGNEGDADESFSMSEGEVEEGEEDPEEEETIENFSDSDADEFSSPAAKRMKLEPEQMTSTAVNWDCCLCDRHFDDYNTWRHHIYRDHLRGSPVCPLCNVSVARVDNCLTHILRAHMQKFNCPLCPTRLTSFKDVDRHMAGTHHGGGFDKSKTLFFFTTMDSLDLINKQKRQIIENWSTWDCTVCTATYNRCRDLRTHMNSEHIDRNTMKCPSCNQEYSSIQHAFRHILQVHLQKWVCRLCSFRGTSTANIVKHMAVEHEILLEEGEDFD